MRVLYKRWMIVFYLLIGLGAGLLSWCFLQQNTKRIQPIPELHQGTWLDHARKIQAFHLQDTDHHHLTLHDLQGHWTFMFFGFTRCGTICPTTMAELAKMYRLLESREVEPLPQVMMVTIDPEQDSLQRLSQYVHAFNAHFLGARAMTQTALKKLTQALGIVYMKVSSPGDHRGIDPIDHSGTVILFNPQGEVVAFFTMPHDAQAMADDYRLITSGNKR